MSRQQQLASCTAVAENVAAPLHKCKGIGVSCAAHVPAHAHDALLLLLLLLVVVVARSSSQVLSDAQLLAASVLVLLLLLCGVACAYDVYDVQRHVASAGVGATRFRQMHAYMLVAEARGCEEWRLSARPFVLGS